MRVKTQLQLMQSAAKHMADAYDRIFAARKDHDCDTETFNELMMLNHQLAALRAKLIALFTRARLSTPRTR